VKLTQIAPVDGPPCADGRTCPTVFTTDRGSVVVQGYQLTSDELAAMSMPSGETAVEIPLALLKEVARAYRT
jgi:hypothetical protein